MNARSLSLFAAAALVFLGLIWLQSERHAATSARKAGQATSPPAGTSAATVGQPLSATEMLQDSLHDILQKLQRGQAGKLDLDAFRRALLSADPHLAAAAIAAFLKGGEDAATQLDFTVGPGGTLEEAPTLRTFLQDVLGEITKGMGDGTLAAADAREVLSTKKSADEWAISMRNLAWSDPAAAPYLAEKMREMLSYKPWLAQPSSGMLEAFDVIVYTGDPGFIPDLRELSSQDDTPLAHAATVALDRLAESSTLAVMNFLNSNTGELAELPFRRADYYSKADLSNGQQRAAVEAYLSRADVSIAEKTKALQELASPGTFISENLLTPPPPVDDSPAKIQALPNTLKEWQETNRFPELNPAIQQLQQRIAE